MIKINERQLQLPILVDVSVNPVDHSSVKQDGVSYGAESLRDRPSLVASEDDELIYNAIVNSYFNSITSGK